MKIQVIEGSKCRVYEFTAQDIVNLLKREVGINSGGGQELVAVQWDVENSVFNGVTALTSRKGGEL